MRRGVSGIFGGIFPALETGFSLVGGEKGLNGSIIRVRVFERKPKHKNYHGCWSGSWTTGKILREQFQSQIILKRFEETFRKREKVFQVSENTTKIRDEFSGCSSHRPLARRNRPGFESPQEQTKPPFFPLA